MATTLGAVAVGSSVYMNVGGVRTEFLVVHQGLPSSLYDSGCDGTWLLMKDIYESRQWHSSNSNSYKASTIHTYLNGTFLNLFDADIKAQIKTVKIPYVNGTGSSAVASGSSGLSAQIFLLSGYEVGWTQSTNQYFPIDGACLSYFSGTSETDSKRIAYLDGAATYWWLRSPRTLNTDGAWRVRADGYFGNSSCSNSYGIRPALVMPGEMGVDDNGNVTQPKPAATSLATIDDTAVEITQCFVTIDGVTCPVPYGLATVDGVTVTIPFGEQASGTPLGDLLVGDSVYMNVNGSPYEFLVVHQGLPSSLYDSSCDGTWLLMKEIYEKRQWHSSENNSYTTSDIHNYLNGTFISLFDSEILNLIKSVKIPYVNGTGGSAVASGSSGLTARAFLLSSVETGNSGNFCPTDGACLSYFSGASNSTRIAMLNGSADSWWTRSPTTNSTNYAWIIGTTGAFNSRTYSLASGGMRPALVMPSTALVDENAFIIAAS